MANKTKPRILPWLREQLDSGHLGATWINAEHTRFFIPWKHGLRRDLGQEDFRIFQAWAEASGCYRPGIDMPDPATWKRNFRAALDRKKNLRVVSNHSRDEENPHKIYEFLPGDGEGCEAGPTAELEDQEEAIQEIMGALSLSTQQQQQDQFGAFSTSSNLEQLPQTPEPALSCNPLMPLFASGLRLRLVGPGPGAETWMELEGTPLALPEPSSTLTDQRAAHFISRVLGSLGAGLALWTSQTELRAQRLGHCGAHWALGEQASPGATGKEVTKERAGQQVCYIPEFVNDLISFLQGSHRSPQYTLWFCLGESWPTESQLWTKKLVMVKVVPTALRALHEVAQAGGASSLEEVDLHISGSLSLSLAPAHLHDYLQGLAHSMQWESGAHC
ncbi:interferon regulatory factor 3 isoform X2 [Petaurus breviceps papuanus]|uniref:interferon regulatory factor 3 isoform X2 n=1 Tax=Petaurus breviceps papuanus TaxID=3040969 RepID=UPI0036D91E8F